VVWLVVQSTNQEAKRRYVGVRCRYSTCLPFCFLHFASCFMLHAFTVGKPSLPGLPAGRAVKSVQLQHKGTEGFQCGWPTWITRVQPRGHAWGKVPVETRGIMDYRPWLVDLVCICLFCRHGHKYQPDSHLCYHRVP
jgi:hypothetical protein